MAHSQNGWPVVGHDSVTDRAVFGAEFPNGWLKGDVDTVFTYLIGRLHREVEPIDKGGCWGWFVKPIEGSAAISNHSSGTAIDYNAPAHPMGTRNTYSAGDRAKIRRILADLGGVVRWGGDYVNRPDDMHFEINAGVAAVRAVARRLKEKDVALADDLIEITPDTAKETGKKAGEEVSASTLLQLAVIHAHRGAVDAADAKARVQAFEAAEAKRDAATAATLAGMQSALSALASASGALTPAEVSALTAQVRAAAEAAGAEAVAALGAKVDALREHLGDDSPLSS